MKKYEKLTDCPKSIGHLEFLKMLLFENVILRDYTEHKNELTEQVFAEKTGLSNPEITGSH